VERLAKKYTITTERPHLETFCVAKLMKIDLLTCPKLNGAKICRKSCKLVTEFKCREPVSEATLYSTTITNKICKNV